MDSLLVGIIGIVILFVCLVFGVHIGVALGLVGFIGYTLLTDFNVSAWMLTNTMYYVTAKFSFIAIPLFVFMGLLAASGGVSSGLYDGLSVWTGRFRAGLGIATVGACTAFGTICGSSLVTAAVFAKVSAPEMRRHGYDKRLAYGICASSGSIGMLIPPSILLVIYGILTEESVGKLLIAGITPGLLLAIFFSLGLVAMGIRMPAMLGVAKKVVATWRQRIASLKLFWPIIIVAVIMIGGIFSGIFGPTEAGAVASAVLIIYTIIFTGRERWKAIGQGLLETGGISAMIFLILGGALMFAKFLTRSGITGVVLEGIMDWDLSPLQLVIVMAGLYIILGCFLDSISMLAITVPVIYPAIVAAGINPIWYAVVAVLAIEVGLITPPVGLNVYATKGVAEPDVSLEDIFRGVMPFFFMMLAALAVLIAFPWLATILPSLMFER